MTQYQTYSRGNKLSLGHLVLHDGDNYSLPLYWLSRSDVCNFNFKKNLYNFLLPIKDNYTEFIVNNPQEIFRFKSTKFDNLPVIETILNVCSRLNIEDKLIFTDNNLTLKTDLFSYFSHPYFLGWNSSENVKIVEKENFKYKFLSLCRIPREHRYHILAKLIENRAIDNTAWSFNFNNPSANLHKALGPSELEFGEHNTAYKIIDEFKTSFVNIVTESCTSMNEVTHYEEGGFDEYSMFITEKTEKCFSSGIPFIMVSTPYFLKELKKLGFKTFDRWWDESYDLEEDYVQRIKKIGDVVDDLNKKSYQELVNMYNEMIPSLKHNQSLNDSFVETNLQNFNSLYYPGSNIDNIEYLKFNIDGII